MLLRTGVPVTYTKMVTKKPTPPPMNSKNSKDYSTVPSSTLTFLRALGSMYPSLARLRLVNSNLWKDQAKIISLISRDESQHLTLTQQILKKWQEGDDPTMVDIAMRKGKMS